MAKVVVLNGTSSAGKSTLAKAVQRLAVRPVLHVRMDDFLEMMPERYANHADAFLFEQLETGDAPQTAIRTGPYGAKLVDGMKRAIAGLADAGLDVIVDDVMLEPGDQDAYRENLSQHELAFVAVYCALDEAERRERERGDRSLGQARWQRGRVHEGVSYELEVHTDAEPTDTTARRIVEAFSL
ncbi:MAG: AAA family ATPase [Henriciella sp.]